MFDPNPRDDGDDDDNEELTASPKSIKIRRGRSRNDSAISDSDPEDEVDPILPPRRRGSAPIPRSPHAHFQSPERSRPDSTVNPVTSYSPKTYLELSSSPLRRLYGPRPVQPSDTTTPPIYQGISDTVMQVNATGRRVSSDISGDVPAWVKDLQASLRGIEERQGKLEAALRDKL